MMTNFKERECVFAEIQPNDGTRYQLLVSPTFDGVEVYIGSGSYLVGGAFVDTHTAHQALLLAKSISERGVPSMGNMARMADICAGYISNAGLSNLHTAFVAVLAAACAYWANLKLDLCDVVEEFYRPNVQNGSIDRVLQLKEVSDAQD
jgi:hypothetical protein